MSGARSARDRLDRITSILARATRFYLLAMATVLVGGAIAVGFAFTRARVYKSETLILYREAIRSSALGEDVGGDPARKLGMRLREMVLSRTRLSQIIDEFHLYTKIVNDRGHVDAVDEMRTHIAFRVRDGDTFGLSFESDDPKLVQAVTARLAEALIAENSRHRVEQATVTKEFLDTEGERIEADLKQKETELAQFLSKHPEFARESSTAAATVGSAILAAKKAMPVGVVKDPTLLALERESMRIDVRLGLSDRRKAAPPTESKVIAEAEAELQAAQKDLSDKLAHFTDQHPDVLVARARMKLAETRLRRWTALESAEARPVDVDARERTTLQEALAKVTAEIAAHRLTKRKVGGAGVVQPSGNASRIVAIETDWTRLSREVVEARTRHQLLEDKLFKASMAQSSASSEHNAQIRIVDPAYLPTHPAKPGRIMMTAVGVIASIGLALALALGCALLDDRIYDRVDIERLEVMPLLAVVPRAKKQKRGLQRRTEPVPKQAGDV
ncbi:MAG: hypothetical protein EXR72_21035 [Myxococcales bacterium]|nr:hypothetical protein [Myxococcales bacterium]